MILIDMHLLMVGIGQLRLGSTMAKHVIYIFTLFCNNMIKMGFSQNFNCAIGKRNLKNAGKDTLHIFFY